MHWYADLLLFKISLIVNYSFHTFISFSQVLLVSTW